MDLANVVGLAGVPVIVALVEVAKQTLELPRRFWALAAVLLGIAWNLGVAVVLHADLAMAVLVGCLAGLSAAGLWSAMKPARQGS